LGKLAVKFSRSGASTGWESWGRTREANPILRCQPSAHIAPNSDQRAIMKGAIALFDGPQQREAQKLAAQALSEGSAL
jgi:hypothetical protein